MYWVVNIGVLLVSVAAVGCVVLVVYRVLQGRSKRRLLSRTHGVLADSPDFIGVSAVCYDIESVGHISELLDVEYPSYELVVVMDSRSKPELFQEILRHYRMMRVEYRPLEPQAALGVRGFYRSERRGFNRLTLLDQMEVFSSLSANAAVRVATYDYILPIEGRVRLVPRAIERLIMELSEYPIGSIQLVRSIVGKPLLLYARESVMEFGGFDRMAWGAIDRDAKITLYERLFFLAPSRHVSLAVGACIAVAVAGAFWTWHWGWWSLTLMLLDVLLLVGLFAWLASISTHSASEGRKSEFGAM
ncbi:MAG: glycosyltransferase family 2 protein [Alistipes sp.]|nr:glycosyltransferase family 2 protein [Alistipes sp.]